MTGRKPKGPSEKALAQAAKAERLIDAGVTNAKSQMEIANDRLIRNLGLTLKRKGIAGLTRAELSGAASELADRAKMPEVRAIWTERDAAERAADAKLLEALIWSSEKKGSLADECEGLNLSYNSKTPRGFRGKALLEQLIEIGRKYHVTVMAVVNNVDQNIVLKGIPDDEVIAQLRSNSDTGLRVDEAKPDDTKPADRSAEHLALDHQVPDDPQMTAPAPERSQQASLTAPKSAVEPDAPLQDEAHASAEEAVGEVTLGTDAIAGTAPAAPAIELAKGAPPHEAGSALQAHIAAGRAKATATAEKKGTDRFASLRRRGA